MEILLIVLQLLKVAFMSAGGFGVLVVLFYTIDLMIEEYNIYKEKWGTREIPIISAVMNHRATRRQLTAQMREKLDAAWAEYFFEDIGRHRVDKKSAFTHAYIAVRPRLHRYIVEVEPVHA